MMKWLKYMVAVVGVPLIAKQVHGFQHDMPKTSLSLLLMAFLTKKRKEIFRVAFAEFLGIVFLGCGFCLVLFSIAQRLDAGMPIAMDIAMMVSAGIFLLGICLNIYCWRRLVAIEHEFTDMIRPHFEAGEYRPTLFKSLFLTFLRALMNPEPSKN